jgi:hypothetical protein
MASNILGGKKITAQKLLEVLVTDMCPSTIPINPYAPEA